MASTTRSSTHQQQQQQQQDGSTASSEWSISVKTVGAEQMRSATSAVADSNDNNNNNASSSNSIPTQFQVRVKPSDDIQSLYDCIEAITGLNHLQQRLIYRGRILPHNRPKPKSVDNAAAVAVSTSTSTKLSEITGLGDGQTIHLVRRNPTPEELEDENEEPSSRTEPAAAANDATATSRTPVNNSSSIRRQQSRSNDEPTGGGAVSSTGSLLAALLGLSVLEEEDGSGGGNWRQRNGGSNNRSRSRQQYRLTAQDLDVEDPGPLETVRQGLLTLHTLLEGTVTSSSATPLASPLDAPRRWYIGQWIDCRDTVNQWLEATIVALVRPDELFPNETTTVDSAAAAARSPTVHPAMDPAVGASDLEGRRRLLLEPCDDGDPDDLGGDLAGYKRRPHDSNVVLVLIHYNGWPHRWDEWIRSDSERLRPFRTRTRHDTSTSVQPVIQTPYGDAPSTRFTEHEAEDRTVVLHELLRVMNTIQTLTEQATQALPTSTQIREQHASADQHEDDHHPDLPWNVNSSSSIRASEANTEVLSSTAAAAESPTIIPADDTDGSERCKTEEENTSPLVTPTASAPAVAVNPSQSLQLLAPLLDRLGRTLVEVAPHIAALAATTASQAATPEPAEPVGVPQDDEHEDDDDYHHNHVTNSEQDDDDEDEEVTAQNSLGGLLSLLNRDRRRTGTTHHTSQTTTDQALVVVDETAAIDPDYTDFATGLVNTSRGEVRAGPRRNTSNGQSSRGGGIGGDDIGGLLGAYLAAASLGGLTTGGGGDNDREGLGRLLRAGGGDGPGIDIHIHAVVTAPMTGGLAMAAAAANAAPPPDLFANTRRATAQRVRATLLEQVNDEDTGIFDDLYSENPDPVSSTTSSRADRDNAAGESTTLPSASSSQHSSSSTTATGSSPHRRTLRRRDPSARGSFWGRLFRRQNS